MCGNAQLRPTLDDITLAYRSTQSDLRREIHRGSPEVVKHEVLHASPIAYLTINKAEQRVGNIFCAFEKEQRRRGAWCE
jgi:hypothetical protein